ncbi:hypothetical protein APX70_00683 [Pseudomonas syringae pv. maculicola]|uniref:Uncharacterized protein n=1 Tax=Pseudomonas syringae pv. maculicola TaxID=59511 RepID=A0A3M3AD81_PSEYM|nr:hypothetical protein APX70_00683 [Pseudomonas syringae pv. maculicola]
MAQQVFCVQPQPAPLLLVRHHRSGPASAVSDRTTDITWPDWRTVFAQRGGMQPAIKLA